MLYPTLSDYLKTLAFKREINRYSAAVSDLDDNTYDEILAAARKHNEKLAAKGRPNIKLSEEEIEEYESLLNISGTSLMGYVQIPKIDISLPIYHGTSSAVLQSGIGHLEWSSLPIGGESTHSIISGHTGLPSAQLFTNIDRLVIGDTFSVYILGETLTYEVDQILTVLPYELNDLKIVKGEDYCTLLTCTPYGVNTHRLLVRGRRIETPDDETGILAPSTHLDYVPESHLTLIIAVAVLVILIIVVLIILLARPRSENTVDKDEENEN